jgi:hypothetical protein
MSYQFLHIESYSRVAAKGKVGCRSLRDIAAEAERQPEACPHVLAPEPPVPIYGCTPSEAAAAAITWAESAHDAKGRHLRRDGLCLLTGVISYPSDRPMELWPAFRTECLEWLLNQYDTRLLSAVEHLDENYPHFHFFAAPHADERFEILHPGRLASAEAKAAGLKKGMQNLRYKDAMRAWQDKFHKEVAIKYALTRLGPRLRRLTRKEWKTEQKVVKLIACETEKLHSEAESIELKKISLEKSFTILDSIQEQAEKAKSELLTTIEQIKKNQQDAEIKQWAEQLANQKLAELARVRRQEWRNILNDFFNPPKSLTFVQAKQRKKLAQQYEYLDHPELLRHMTVKASSKGRATLRKIHAARQNVQAQVSSAGGLERIELLRRQLLSCNPWQFFDKKRIATEIRKIKNTLEWAAAETKKLDLQEKKLIESCPDELIEKYRQKMEENREKAVLELMQQEFQEAEQQVKPLVSGKTGPRNSRFGA